MRERWIVALGVLLHALYMLSIFDIYFKSPIVHGMDPVQPRIQPPAKRLVLFIADGMRADKFFELKPDGSPRAPFLHNVMHNKGRWGVSHARPPTESRPGHVAIIAGFYEDPSAVTKGWKANPVEFDSVFNRSQKTLAFGSPDIVPIFCSKVPQAEYAAYPPEYEDFATDASFLDVWAFEKLERRLNKSKELDEVLQSDGLVIFLHLLGCDTNGHAHRPYSSIYLNNIEVVDRGIQRIFETIEQRYGDQQTAYIFTADHGMSDKGSHGDGDPANTETPLVAWGAGVRGPSPASANQEDDGAKFVDEHSHHMTTPKSWGLDHLERMDVNQGDIAPLMSLLLGLPCPLNSVGVLPRGYLSLSEVDQAEAMFANAKQILNQFLLKSRSKQAVTLLFKPFLPLHDSDHMVNHIQQLISESQHQQAVEASENLVNLSLEGLHYFQTYDWRFLMGTISVGYLGWMTYLVLHLVKNYTNMWPEKRARVDRLPVRVFWGTVMALLSAKMLLEKSPWLYFFYVGMTCFLWEEVSHDIKTIVTVLRGARGDLSKMRLFCTTSAALVIVQLLVFSFFNRAVYTGIFLTAGVLGGLVLLKNAPGSSFTAAFVMFACWFLSGFTLMPTQISENTELVVIGCASALALSLAAWWINHSRPKQRILQRLASEQKHGSHVLFFTQVFLLVLSAGMVWITTSYRTLTRSLPVVIQILNWSLAGFSMLLPLRSPPTVLSRLTSVFLGFAPPFMLLSVGYEALFYSGLGLVLMSWIIVESALLQDPPKVDTDRLVQWNATGKTADSWRPVNLKDFHVAVFFLVLINEAFFGTGNFASIASFEISSVYRFITIFDPFVMAALLLFKLFIPFILVTCAFSVVVKILRLPRLGCYFMVLLLSDIMTIQFFFLVRNTGSWMEIGNSISHFGIMSAQVIFVLLLFAASHIFTRDVRISGRPDLMKQF